MKPNTQNPPDQLNKLVETALSLGASAAKVLPSTEIISEERLANFCIEPRCPAYGLSASCPPYVAGPEGFHQLQHTHQDAVAIKIDVLAAALFGDDRPLVLRVLHEVVSGVEHEAVRLGYSQSQAFAGGSCKQIFCSEEADCRKVSQGICRHPEIARPSMSGYGIHVAKLMESCGWDTKMITHDTQPEEGTISWTAGLVMIG